MLITTKDTYIHYVSEAYKGKTHDYKVLKEEFAKDINWFEERVVRLDLGYIGFNKDYKSREAILPHKKPKGGYLRPEQEADNRIRGRERISVEHSIARMKKYPILSNRLRMHDDETYNRVLGICAGLSNFSLKC